MVLESASPSPWDCARVGRGVGALGLGFGGGRAVCGGLAAMVGKDVEGRGGESCVLSESEVTSALC